MNKSFGRPASFPPGARAAGREKAMWILFVKLMSPADWWLEPAQRHPEAATGRVSPASARSPRLAASSSAWTRPASQPRGIGKWSDDAR